MDSKEKMLHSFQSPASGSSFARRQPTAVFVAFLVLLALLTGFPEPGLSPAPECRAATRLPAWPDPSTLQTQEPEDDSAACSPNASETVGDESKGNPDDPARGVDGTAVAPFKFEKHGAIVYSKSDDYRLTLDVYQPEGTGPFPVVLAIHGGGWRGGSKITMTRHAWLFARSGYVVVAINYRFAPEYPFPAQVVDCKRAIRWIRRHAGKYNIDPDRLIAFGYSAGGHLAAMLGVTDPDDGLEGDVEDPPLQTISTRVQAVICGGAVCDFEWIDPDSPILAFWLGGTPHQRPEAYRLAAPISHVTPDDPPLFIYHGADDMVVPPESAQRFHAALKKAGVPSRFVEVPGKGHVRTFVDLSLMSKAIDFLRQDVGLDVPPIYQRSDSDSQRPEGGPRPTQ